jgi:predicted enzyme related to lactoylglutathione lyase
MALVAGMVTIDCEDPAALAPFWTEALDFRIVSDWDGEYLVLAGEIGPRVSLQRVPEPRTGKNRVHLDLAADDRAAEVSRLVALGATVLDEHAVPGLYWTVLADPEGNEFCVGSDA